MWFQMSDWVLHVYCILWGTHAYKCGQYFAFVVSIALLECIQYITFTTWLYSYFFHLTCMLTCHTYCILWGTHVCRCIIIFYLYPCILYLLTKIKKNWLYLYSFHLTCTPSWDALFYSIRQHLNVYSIVLSILVDLLCYLKFSSVELHQLDSYTLILSWVD